MNRILLFVSMLLLLVSRAFAADAEGEYDPKPLPSGPLLKKMPNYAAWQVIYVFEVAKASASPTGDGATPPGDAAKAPVSHLPKLLTITQTKPVWHAVAVDLSGEKRETWSDGTVRYEVGATDSEILPISNSVPGNEVRVRNYFGTKGDFPDMDWISAKTYLGTQKGTAFWVFKGPEGMMAWIDSGTLNPVRWKKGAETRTFQILPEPTSPLVLPPRVARLSEAIKRLDVLSRSAPPHL